MASTFRFHIQTELPVGDLAVLWRDLESRANCTFFLSWHWMSAWIAGLGGSPPLLIGEVAGTLALMGFIVPYARRGAGVIRFRGARLHSTGRWDQDCIAIEYNGFLVDRRWEGRIEQEAIGWLLNQSKIAAMRPQELHITAMLAQQRATWTPANTVVQIPNRKPSWRVDLAGLRTAGSSYLESLSANTRQQIRRSMRLYNAAGGLSATWATDVPTALTYLDGLKELHQRQWQNRGHRGGFASSFFEDFQRRLISDALPNKSVELVRVSCGDTAIGYLYNLVWRDHVFAFVSGLRFPEDNRLKPGLVCHALCIEHHLQHGAAVYDFMAGDFRYKASLGQPGPEFIYLLIQKDTPTARLEQLFKWAQHRLRRLS